MLCIPTVAMSMAPSPSKSPAAVRAPTSSYGSSPFRSVAPPDRPCAPPQITVSVPADPAVPIFSLPAPTTRSLYPSLSRSAETIEPPNPSPASAESGMPGEFWVKTCLVEVCGPFLEPYTTATYPALDLPSTVAPGAVNARSG
ncbi:hypothetical protein EES42_09070 [Streptomyces sp. ADI95-17]|nr:hypothetical protein EES42_09070 [Streptomyces sp. ADI95-17]